MKTHFPTILITLLLVLVTGSGCASVMKVFQFDHSDNEQEYSDDPVAAAAMKLRRPASSGRADFAEGDWGQGHRYSAPPAETISLGMGMNDVAAIWGEPGNVDAAGDPREGNQRWTYYSGLSSRYGLGGKRVVFFENGRVAGWKNAK